MQVCSSAQYAILRTDLAIFRLPSLPAIGIVCADNAHIAPEHNVPHFSKLFDIHMMCWGTGQERTEAQYLSLLERAGWKPAGAYYPENRQMGIITGVRA